MTAMTKHLLSGEFGMTCRDVIGPPLANAFTGPGGARSPTSLDELFDRVAMLRQSTDSLIVMVVPSPLENFVGMLVEAEVREKGFVISVGTLRLGELPRIVRSCVGLWVGIDHHDGCVMQKDGTSLSGFCAACQRRLQSRGLKWSQIA
jgi:hypothetical protein